MPKVNSSQLDNFKYQIWHSFSKKAKLEENVVKIPFQVEERRLGLEKYLQLLSQDHRVVTGISFNGFLLGAQQVSRYTICLG